mmetsp:Transcript_4825/g.14046  ORF Transcript_4825/g.14046 Transcript_4825/m.14046 type:complete len:276 (+) Transcript_4825:112-939(+)
MEADYQNLGVVHGASAQEVKTQFRKLAREVHPDKNRDDPEAAERFRELHDSFVAIEQRRSSSSLRGWAAWLVGQEVPAARRRLGARVCGLLSRCVWPERGEQAGPPGEPPELGDLVLLGLGCPEEHRGCAAVVTELREEHCTVAVLDETRRYAIGNCWPCFNDISVQSRAWRLGARVAVSGMKGSATKGFNGCVGTIARHPREGHPSFVCKASAPNTPQLVVCVRFDDAAAAGKVSALLEPRFLVPYEAHLTQVAQDLENATADLRMQDLRLQDA